MVKDSQPTGSSLAELLRGLLPVERMAVQTLLVVVGVAPILGLIGLISLIGSRCGPPA